MTQSLQSLVEQQVEQLSQLSSLLEQELHLISTRDAESLMSLLKEKELTLEAIGETDNRIDPLYRDAKQNDALTDDVEQGIDKAKVLLEDCQYRTEINQKAVEQGQLRLTHLRNLMLEVRAKESLTYDKSGKPKGTGLGPGVSA
ncbi:flagellar export chaperone FlgN [Alteromonas antoniana]|uniref:flagellar export chaperone FlgN n=1 Tax=Alteromonas antoniana TaxID=2803813 RepID=UPI001C47A894|nr:flagellar export chaperone FlgN [Alteromonas antoniana]